MEAAVAQIPEKCNLEGMIQKIRRQVQSISVELNLQELLIPL